MISSIGEIREGDTLYCIRGGVRLDVGTILAKPSREDRIVYYISQNNESYQVHFKMIKKEYMIEHNKKPVKRIDKPARAIRHISNAIYIKRRLNRI